MSSEPQTFNYKPTADLQPVTAKGKPRWRIDFQVPFVIAVSLTLPSLVVLALTRQSAGFDALDALGYFQLVLFCLWGLMAVMVVSGLLAIKQHRSMTSRLATGLFMLLIGGLFAYILVA